MDFHCFRERSNDLCALGSRCFSRCYETSGNGKTDFLSLTKKLLTFPPFLAIPVALLLPQVISFEPIEPVFTSLAATLSPLALFSVGLQFQIGNIRNDWKPIAIAVGYKLILAPLIICLLAILLGISGMFAKLSVFEAAMGTMISAGILNNEFGLNPRLSNLIVFVGILLSFITSGIWYLVMERFFP
jgi:malate permease and related proteins